MPYWFKPQPTQDVNIQKVGGIYQTTSTGTTGQVTVGTTATLVAAANSNRRALIIVNNSGNSVYIGIDNTVTTTTGVELPTGAVLNVSRLFEGYTGAIYAIAAVSSTISYIEF